MLLVLALTACSTDATDSSGETGGGGPTITAPDLVINEVLASNDTINTDAAGEYDDWVEIYNRSDAVVQFDGFYLSDDPAEPTKFAFPTGDGITAHGFKAVWCDGQPEQSTASEYHAPFKLNKKGDALILSYAKDNQIVTVDSVDWNAGQTADEAAARVPDGSEGTGGKSPWVIQAPTFETSNGG